VFSIILFDKIYILNQPWATTWNER